MNKYLKLCTGKGILFKLIILFALIGSLPLTGSDCDNGIIGNGTTGSILGTWYLTGMTGYLQDICAGEIVNFDSTGIATLQCPNSSPITRNYTVSNNILTYTETGVQYDITNLSSTTLILEGRNVGRTLSYSRQPADYLSNYPESKSEAGNNSSEYYNKEIKH